MLPVNRVNDDAASASCTLRPGRRASRLDSRARVRAAVSPPEDDDEQDEEAPETPLDEPPPVPVEDPPPTPDKQPPYVVRSPLTIDDLTNRAFSH